MSFDSNGDYFLTAGEDETFHLYSCKTGKPYKKFYSHKYGIDIPRFTHKSTCLIHTSLKEDDTIRYHSMHDNRYLQYFKGHKKRVISLEMSPYDDSFISGSLDNTVRLWDLRTPNARGLLHVPAPPVVAFDGTGVVFAVAVNEYFKILLYDMQNFDKDPFLTIHLDDMSLAKRSFPPRLPFITSLAFASSGKHLLVGTSSDRHYICDSFDGHLVCALVGHVGLEAGKADRALDVKAGPGISREELCWTPDSRWVFGGSRDGRLLVWDVTKIPSQAVKPGQDLPEISPSVTLEGHNGPIRCVRFNPRHAMLATAGAELAFWLPDLAGDADESVRRRPGPPA